MYSISKIVCVCVYALLKDQKRQFLCNFTFKNSSDRIMYCSYNNFFVFYILYKNQCSITHTLNIEL